MFTRSNSTTGRSLWSALARPVSPEMRRLLAQRWQTLPPRLKTDRQVLGRDLVHCGYTLGPAYCSFGCTHCYLPRNANRVPLPTLAAMREQILANRQLVGPGGGLQITGGDVVDAYWRAGRGEELIEILRYANVIGTVPMLMTHGQTLLENPRFLHRLVREGGLRKLGLHIDMTQAGRRGYPIRSLAREADLNPVRDAFVRLIRDTRRLTGKPLSAAHLLTATERNIHSLGDVLRWLTAEPQRLDVFRTVSFQTEADVGRTRLSEQPVTPERVWQQICASLGTTLPRDGLWFGHPDCTSMTMLLVDESGRRVLNLVPDDPAGRAFWAELLRVFGGTGASGEARHVRWARFASAALRNPHRVAGLTAAALRLLRREGLGAGFAWRFVRGRARGLNLVMHNFMGREQLAQPRDATTEQRLAACSFRGVTECDGRWVAQPMCTMNTDHRGSLYDEQIASAEVQFDTARLRAV